jgi:DNA-binding NarL/FixJ family response regulator
MTTNPAHAVSPGFPEDLLLPKRALQDFRVLIVDDSEYMQKLLRSFFNVIGVREIRTASDAESARRILNSNQPHLVLTDLKMRPVSGLDFIKAVRSGKDVHDPQVPIVVVTGFADRSTVQQVKAAGANGILVKPVSLDALREHVAPLIASVRGGAASANATSLDAVPPSEHG